MNKNKPIDTVEYKAHIGRILFYDEKTDKPYITYLLFAYDPYHTSSIIDFEELEDKYRFETLHTIYEVNKDQMILTKYTDIIEELKDYLNSEEFKEMKKIKNLIYI